MERQLFDWENWDSVDEGAMIFYDITMKVDISYIKIGTKFKSVCVDYQRGLLEFYDDEGKPMCKWKLELKVKELVPYETAM